MVAVVSSRGPSPLGVIREQHWLELAEYLGQTPAKTRATLDYWFRLLTELGYELSPTGMNHEAARPAPTAPAPAPPVIEHSALYQAVEDGLLEVTTRRGNGERISDQAEVRTIVAKVLELIAAPG